MWKISVVLPVYNEVVILQQVLEKYFEDLKQVGKEFEIVAVNDGCDDGSEKILAEFAKNNRNFRVVNFDRRFGKQAAITAGMDVADRQSAVVILGDIDILNPVGVIGKIVERMEQGEKIVYARRENFGFDRVKAFVSDVWTRVGAKMFGLEGRYTGKANLAAYAREVVDVMLTLPTMNKYLRTMNTWVGWEISYLTYASGYNKIEERNIIAEVKRNMASSPLAKTQNVHRDKVREQTGALDYVYGLLISAGIMFVFGIVYASAIGGPAWAHLLLWLGFFMLLFLGFIMFTKAIVIKRIGIIHKSQEKTLYEIKNILN